jgi:hypothetical protein
MASWLRTTVAFAMALSACATTSSDNAVFTAQSLPEHQPASVARVAVFGVFHDGRMNAEMWPRLSERLGFDGCDAAYGAPMHDADPDAFDAVTRYAMKNGPDDVMIAPFDGLARGDVVLFLQVYGMPTRAHPAGAGSSSSRPSQAPPPPSSGYGGRRGMRGMRGGYGGAPRATRSADDDTQPFEMSASLYSPTLHKTVAFLRMRYTGHSLDEALAKFATQLHAQMPSATCGGWDWSAHADLARMQPPAAAP